MSNVPATRASQAVSTTTIPEAIVGLRRDGTAIVLIESNGKEHRLEGADALWRLAWKMLAADTQVVTGKAEPSEAKRQRDELAKAFVTLGKKARDRAAESIGEDTVGAAETIARVAGGRAVEFLRRNAVHGRSSLGIRAARACAGSRKR